jgi:hypothetical protein
MGALVKRVIKTPGFPQCWEFLEKLSNYSLLKG